MTLHLFEHKDFKGNYVVIRASTRSLVPLGFNDKTSSLTVTGSSAKKEQWYLYSDVDFKGDRAGPFTAGQYNLADLNIRNDWASSVFKKVDGDGQTVPEASKRSGSDKGESIIDDLMQGDLDGVADTIKDAVTNNPIVDTVEDAIDTVGDTLEGLAGVVTEIVKAIADAMKEIKESIEKKIRQAQIMSWVIIGGTVLLVVGVIALFVWFAWKNREQSMAMAQQFQQMNMRQSQMQIDMVKAAAPIAGTAIGASYGGPVGAQMGGQMGSQIAGMNSPTMSAMGI